MLKVVLPPNVPQTIALQDPEGDFKPDEAQVEYLTTCGRLLVLNQEAATRLNMLDLKPGETFTICKRVGVSCAALPGESERYRKRRGELPYIDLALTAATERDRAEAEAAMPPAESPQTPRPAGAIPRRKRTAKVHEMRPDPPIQPRLFDRKGTGTYGPVQQPGPTSSPALQPIRHAPPARIPFNVAFVEVTRFVTGGLKELGEQWTDAAKQDAISTILISAAKQGMLTLWERPAND